LDVVYSLYLFILGGEGWRQDCGFWFVDALCWQLLLKFGFLWVGEGEFCVEKVLIVFHL
jgi:hypothetical protein